MIIVHQSRQTTQPTPGRHGVGGSEQALRFFDCPSVFSLPQAVVRLVPHQIGTLPRGLDTGPSVSRSYSMPEFPPVISFTHGDSFTRFYRAGLYLSKQRQVLAYKPPAAGDSLPPVVERPASEGLSEKGPILAHNSYYHASSTAMITYWLPLCGKSSYFC